MSTDGWMDTKHSIAPLHTHPLIHLLYSNMYIHECNRPDGEFPPPAATRPPHCTGTKRLASAQAARYLDSRQMSCRRKKLSSIRKHTQGISTCVCLY
mmetsp:Transcript_13727/g.39534  ORF Transcript_13727/g.39534 Transcript_13727/m.39534 type:complete len:97 (-) Transcript_13727:942-1232(-)